MHNIVKIVIISLWNVSFFSGDSCLFLFGQFVNVTIVLIEGLFALKLLLSLFPDSYLTGSAHCRSHWAEFGPRTKMTLTSMVEYEQTHTKIWFHPKIRIVHEDVQSERSLSVSIMSFWSSTCWTGLGPDHSPRPRAHPSFSLCRLSFLSHLGAKGHENISAVSL